MRLPRTMALASTVSFFAALFPPAPAFAQEETTAEPTEAASGDIEEELEPEDDSRWGFGPRVRYLFLPQSVLELFLDHATSLSSFSIGGELSYRLDTLDIVVSLDYSNGDAEDGLYLEKGDNANTVEGAPDFTEFDGFGLLSVDITFLWHLALHDRVALRGGLGLGAGLVLGEIYQTDTVCVGIDDPSQLDDPNACTKTPGTRKVDEDVPGVIPVVNLLLGLRFKVTPDLTVNVEGGFRNAFFFGVGGGYFF